MHSCAAKNDADVRPVEACVELSDVSRCGRGPLLETEWHRRQHCTEAVRWRSAVASSNLVSTAAPRSCNRASVLTVRPSVRPFDV